MSDETIPLAAPAEHARLPSTKLDVPSGLDRLIGYGWAPIIIGAIAMAATYPGRTHGLGMITEPLLADLRLSTPEGRVFYSSLNFWGTLIGALFCLPVGWLFDRVDRRILLASNLVLLGAAVLGMSSIRSWQELFVGIVLTRGLGQSALSVVSLTIVAKSFHANRLGIAMAWYAVLAVPCQILLIKGVGWALAEANYGWRTVWGCVGVAITLLAASAAFLSPPLAASKERSDAEQVGSTLSEALSTSAFWVFSLTISLWGMIYAGVALFNADIFQERGWDKQLYFNVLALVTVVGLAFKFLFGWLVSYVALSRLLASCLFITAVCLASLPVATQRWHAYAYGVGLGMATGAVALLFFSAWGKLYGQRELGRIQGVAQMMSVVASACGPLLFSLGKQTAASYSAVFQFLALLVLSMAIIAWFTPIPSLDKRKAML